MTSICGPCDRYRIRQTTLGELGRRLIPEVKGFHDDECRYPSGGSDDIQ